MKGFGLIKTVCSFLLVVGLIAFWSGTPLFATGVLDGKTFVGEMGKKGEQNGQEEDVIFTDGKMRSSMCNRFGYSDGTYTTTMNGDATVFETQLTHPTDGTQKWTGTVKGDTLEAVSSSQKPGEAPTEMWVKGQLKK